MNAFDYSLVRLFPSDSIEIFDHITSLSPEDQYLRFGYAASPDNVDKYIASTMSTINTRNKGDFWFGIKSGQYLAATLHVAIYDDVAEFAFTTSTDHRGKKLGQLLFARAYQLACEFSVTKIYLSCLTKNGPVRHIAKKFGLSVYTMGTDSEASVNISYPVPLSRLNEVKMMIIDKEMFEGKL